MAIQDNISLEFFLESEMFRAKVVEKIKAHILRKKKNCTFYKKMWKNMVEPGWARNIYLDLTERT